MAAARVCVRGGGPVGPFLRNAESRPRLPALLRAWLCAQPDLLPAGSTVIVALSGGPDSAALLHLLSGLAASLDLRLEAAHFDHQMRAGSGADAKLAARLAADVGVPCHQGVPAAPPRPKQASLRDVRYAWLQELAGERRADRLAVGHHADDQAETVLFRLMRGTDLRGLAGMPLRRGRIVRPLLPFRRRAVIAYLEELGAPWLEDPSNMDRRWARVRIRTEVIPGLERLNPAAVPRLLALSAAAARATGLAERLAARLLAEATVGSARQGHLELSRETLCLAGTELAAVALRQAARAAGVELTAGGTRAGVEFISEGRSGGRVNLGGGLELWREYDRVVIGRPVEPVRPEALLVHGRTGAGRVRIGERALVVRWRPVTRAAALPERIAVAVSPGHYPLMFRGWRAGDRIRLAGGTRKLKKLFADRRIPLSERARLPVLADRLGNILWIEGLAVAENDEESGTNVSFLEFELSYE